MKSNSFFPKDRLDESQVERFKLFEDESLIFATREHWLPLSIRLFQKMFGSILVAFLAFVITILASSESIIAVSVLALILLAGFLMIINDLVHWSFHLYIATNKQIVEVHYSPLFSEVINSILLDNIRCTEIDVEMFGLIPELLGIGNVAITFDRPTHEEEFIIKDVRSPRKLANLLSAHIHQLPEEKDKTQHVWVKELEANKHRYLGEINYGYGTS